MTVREWQVMTRYRRAHEIWGRATYYTESRKSIRMNGAQREYTSGGIRSVVTEKKHTEKLTENKRK